MKTIKAIVELAEGENAGAQMAHATVVNVRDCPLHDPVVQATELSKPTSA